MRHIECSKKDDNLNLRISGKLAPNYKYLIMYKFFRAIQISVKFNCYAERPIQFNEILL